MNAFHLVHKWFQSIILGISNVPYVIDNRAICEQDLFDSKWHNNQNACKWFEQTQLEYAGDSVLPSFLYLISPLIYEISKIDFFILSELRK